MIVSEANMLKHVPLPVLLFNDLQILKLLGGGSFSKVYLATHPELGTVALKVLLPYHAEQKKEVKFFIREALLLAKCRHRSASPQPLQHEQPAIDYHASCTLLGFIMHPPLACSMPSMLLL